MRHDWKKVPGSARLWTCEHCRLSSPAGNFTDPPTDNDLVVFISATVNTSCLERQAQEVIEQ